MIKELSIKNFAIIDDISITFHDGLTVLTGETGAGKSIIIDAVQLLTGERGSVDFVRHGQKKAEITGLFFMEQGKIQILKKCDKYGIELEEDTIILERTITSHGKSICRINGKIVTLAVLREFGQAMVTIHSQHDNIQLMNPKNHLYLLDLYNIDNITPIKKNYVKVYEQLLDLKKQYAKLTENEQQTAQRIDLLQFQLTELEEAALEANEDELLTKERDQLHNFEKIYRSVNEAYQALYGERKALEYVDIAQNTLQASKSVDAFIEKQADELTNLYYSLEEMSFTLRDYNDNLHFDEARLNEMETRLNDINRLKKKYGTTVSEMLQYQQKIKMELSTLQHKDTHIETLQIEINKITEQAIEKAEKLHTVRKDTAKLLEKDIKTELNDLYLENAAFSVHFEEDDQFNLHQNGIDKINFLLSTNIGEPLKELSKTASGGELSRIMLALKKLFAKHDQIATVIFDEIDTGVSGRVAQAIAEKMFQIASTTQVLGITHLPQVAAMSDSHLLIEKTEKNKRTSTMIHELNKDEKIQELGKMITGTKLTATAIEHAEELLDLSKSFKSSIYSKS